MTVLFSYLYDNDYINILGPMYDKELTKNDLHGLSAIAKHCLHAHLKKKQEKCLHVFTHGLLVHTYTTGLMITLRADRKVSTSLTAYVTYLPDSKQKSTEARSMCSLFYPFIDVLVLNWPVYFTYLVTSASRTVPNISWHRFNKVMVSFLKYSGSYW